MVYKVFDGSYFKGNEIDSKLIEYFSKEEVIESLEKIAKKIYKDFGKVRVLDINCVGGFLVNYLRSEGVDSFGISYSDRIVDEIPLFKRSYCFKASFKEGILKKLPQKFDIVVFIHNIKYINYKYFNELILTMKKFSNRVLFGSFCFEGDEENYKYVKDEVAFAFAKEDMFRNLNYSFKTPGFNIDLFEVAQIKDFANIIYEYEGYIKNDLTYKNMLKKENDFLNRRILSYSKNFAIFKGLNYKYNKLKKEVNELKLQNRALRIIEQRYEEIRNAFFWKITKPARVLVTFFRWFCSNFRRILFFILKNIQPKRLKTLIIFLLQYGFIAGCKRVFLRQRQLQNQLNHLIQYKEYFKKVVITKRELESQRKIVFEKTIVFSVVVPLYNTPIKFLKDMIDSVIGQTYPFWQLCLADGSDEDNKEVEACCKEYAQRDSRIVYKKLEKNEGISENTNEAIKMATGDYIALVDHDDMLALNALFENAKVINEKGADFIYSDEMTFLGDDIYNITFMNFKPDFSPDFLNSNNYICHLTVFSKELQQKVGFFKNEYDGSQDYDFILRLSENAKVIYHIPKLLYYWRASENSVAKDINAKPYCADAGKRALAAHFKRLGVKAKVKDADFPTTYEIDYEIIGEPLVSIIIPNKDHILDLSTCIKSILNFSTYKNFEIIIIENGSDFETLDYYKVLQNEDKRIRVVYYKGGFNYSAINNFGVTFARGDYFIFLNNDTEVITPDWIEQMLMFAQRDDVGAVGVKLFYSDDTIQHMGVVIGIMGLAGHPHKHLPRNIVGYCRRTNLVSNLSAVTAACVMVSRRAFVSIGGFDEEIKVAFNDVDFCLRLRKAGFLIVFTPRAELYHHESKSRGEDDTPEKFARFSYEVEFMQKRWDEFLKKGDPYYNKNLTLANEGFGLRFEDKV